MSIKTRVFNRIKWLWSALVQYATEGFKDPKTPEEIEEWYYRRGGP